MFQRTEQLKQFGITAVENIFFSEYLPAADGDQLKVYLYGLYQSQFALEDFGVSELAQALSMEEGLVLSALRYWERRRLVERVSDKPPTYVFHHLGQRLLSGQDQLAFDEQYVIFSEAVNTQLGSRRKLRESDIAMAYEWVEELGLRQEVVLMLLNHFADTRGAHFSFKSAQTTAVMMKEEGISSPDEAEQYFNHSKKTHQGARAVLSQFNLRRLPTEPELALYRKWTEQWGFDDNAVLEAVAETVAANNPSFSYLNSILERLKNKTPGKGKRSVAAQLKQEGLEAAEVKQVLMELGRPQISPYALLPVYAGLKENYGADMVLLAARSVAARNGMFEDLEPRLLAWREQGFNSPEQVVNHLRALKEYEPLMRQVFELSGQEGRPGETDLMRLNTWLVNGNNQALILEAAAQARSARQKLSYIEKVLDSWQKAGVKTLEMAKAQASKPQEKPKRKVGFQDYEQGQADSPYVGIDLLKEAREADGQ